MLDMLPEALQFLEKCTRNTENSSRLPTHCHLNLPISHLLAAQAHINDPPCPRNMRFLLQLAGVELAMARKGGNQVRAESTQIWPRAT